MTEHTNTDVGIRPEVRDFVAAVRAQLRDLSTEDQQELTEGLEADLSDQYAEQGSAALGDPVRYASELRVAAGFSAEPARSRERGSIGESVSFALDASHHRWDALVSGLPGDPWEFVQSLRPTWWVLRAWVALQLVDLLWGNGSYQWGLAPLPTLGPFSWPLLIIAVVASVQLGRGKIWPGRPKSGPSGRVLLLVLNAGAIGLLPIVSASLMTPDKVEAWFGYDQTSVVAAQPSGPHNEAGIYAHGKWISQIYPYDASGEPLVGVQLFDQEGDPIEAITQTECVYDADGSWVEDQGRVYYPWTNGAAQVHNVFPVPSVIPESTLPDPDPQAFERKVKPRVQQFPFVKVPAISLPGIATSKGETPKGAIPDGTLPKTPINPIDNGC